jgi:hypothetical protein
MRLCVDYRSLNKKTVPDRHPIPRIQETLEYWTTLVGTNGLVYLTKVKLIIRVSLIGRASQ